MELLNTPILNKGTAFTDNERTRLGLHGLLPPQVETIDEQVVRAYDAYQRKDDDLERHIYLRALQDTNEVLFYRLLLDHIEEMTPKVYTPVVALACQHFSQIYRRPRGLFIPYPRRDSIEMLLDSRPNRDIDVIVVTDGERILGIGDQGVGGLGIPIGKLSLYSLIGGIHPARTLPIVLDVGTNNPDRLSDPEYLGWRHERVTGQAYFDFIDQFVTAVKQEMPGVCLQWEDFASKNARPILQRYRDQLLTFNDDIQGTAGVTVGAVLSATKLTGKCLKEYNVIFLGAGSAAIGVADGLRAEMVRQGMSDADARRQIWILNRKGLLVRGRGELSEEQQGYAQHPEAVAGWNNDDGKISLAEVISRVDNPILIGLSTSAGAFTEEIVRTMAKKVERPIILPLSNPTDKSEAKPADLIQWTEGRAIVATGSPFDPVKHGNRWFPIAQCNNVYIFPALGLGIVASRATRVTDSMIGAAARALAENSPAQHDPQATLLPNLRDLRGVAREIAVAVGIEAQAAGVAPKTSNEDLRARVTACQWAPEYPARLYG
jgi:malate dehydrogenase (oxaloacetate-decarboxylating)